MRKDIRRAQHICRDLLLASPADMPALTAFSQGNLVGGFAREVRYADRHKATWLNHGLISARTYQDIVWLDRFCNTALDEGLASIRLTFNNPTNGTLATLCKA